MLWISITLTDKNLIPCQTDECTPAPAAAGPPGSPRSRAAGRSPRAPRRQPRRRRCCPEAWPRPPAGPAAGAALLLGIGAPRDARRRAGEGGSPAASPRGRLRDRGRAAAAAAAPPLRPSAHRPPGWTRAVATGRPGPCSARERYRDSGFGPPGTQGNRCDKQGPGAWDDVVSSDSGNGQIVRTRDSRQSQVLSRRAFHRQGTRTEGA